jgi:hypothetical protein
MTCIRCNQNQTKKFGKCGKQKVQRYRCNFCNT